jgi:opacity protein-like surface antigen
MFRAANTRDPRCVMAETLGEKDSMSARHFPVCSTGRIATSGVALVFCLVLGIVPATIAADDSYIAGYAAAVLEHEFSVPGAILQVQEGVVVVTADSLGKVDRQKVIAALEKIPGVVRAEVREGPPPSAAPAGPPQAALQQEVPKPESKFLPRGLLVAPFHADPRWPHFSVASRHLSYGQEPSHTGSANFGETFALYRNAAPLDGQWEIALQAGVFSIFNMNAGSTDLVNADYTVGLLTSYRTGPFSGFLRLHHQSSHLGDEFIINSQTPINRVNLSFEEVDLKVSYELGSWFRIYGGGGMLVGRDPNDLQRGTSQVGAELTSPWTLWDGKVRPVAYTDFQANARSNWRVGSSVMAGLQFENARIGDRKIQLLAEYFSGPSPNGQFYSQNTEWLGVGVHLYY